MNRRSPKLLLVALILLQTGCFSLSGWKELTPGVDAASGRVGLDQPEAVKRALYAQLREWRSVPNRIGGLSKSGVDCSGFAYLTYRSYFGIELPRSTRQQAGIGSEISKGELRPGDLVFFKTGVVQRHVGMYTDGGKFIHASTSRGVMESRLDNPYWIRNYWKSVRVRL
ncbi:MAG: glycoside hydrolase [Gammaproteobacteria bacterium]|nr:glycoside hydrolase [Gammaproteobacteria bacterium]